MSNASAWMVHDDSGRIWPPNFRASVHVQKPTNWQLALVQAGAAGEKARQEGRGWGKGTIEGLTKPLIPAGARVTRPYQFRGAVGGHVSCAHAVWSWLRSNPGSELSDTDAGAMLGIRAALLRQQIGKAIKAGVIDVHMNPPRTKPVALYRLGPVAPVVPPTSGGGH